MTKNIITIESKVPVQDSTLWSLQKDLFLAESVTSHYYPLPNPYLQQSLLARQYAFLVALFVKEHTSEHPILIYDLFPCNGKLLYAFLYELRAFFPDQSDLPFRYILGCESEENQAYFNGHQQLQADLDSGWLMTALFDRDHPQILQLDTGPLDLNDSSSPLVILAHDYLRYLPVSLHYIYEDHYQDLVMSAESTADHLDFADYKSLSKIDTPFQNVDPTPSPSLPKPYLSLLETTYPKTFKSTTLSFPLTATHMLASLMEKTDTPTLFLASDYGYSNESHMDYLSQPSLQYQGFVSAYVNFQALGHGMRDWGCQTLMTEHKLGYQVFIASKNTPIQNGVSSRTLFQDHFQLFFGLGSIDDPMTVRQSLEKLPETTPDLLFAHLRQQAYDPDLFYQSYNVISDSLPDLTPDQLSFLRTLLKEVLNRTFYTPFGSNIPFDIGNMYYALQDYQEALDCYDRSLTLYDPNYGDYYNLGLCHYYLKDREKALEFFRKAQAIDESDNNEDIQNWIDSIENELKILG